MMNLYLKKMIEQSNLSELEIAQKLNVDIVTLRLWEDGSYPQKIEQLKKLSDILEINTDSIIFSDNYREPLKLSGLKPGQKKMVYDLYLALKSRGNL